MYMKLELKYEALNIKVYQKLKVEKWKGKKSNRKKIKKSKSNKKNEKLKIKI